MPVRARVLHEAYEILRDWGDLPADDRVADAVLRKALRRGEDAARTGTLERAIQLVCVAEERRAAGIDPPTLVNVRESLFCEAMGPNPILRQFARAAIAVEVAHGGDVEDPEFASRHGLPKHNSVAMHELGYPQRLAIPPYVEQAQRLFARYDDLRERIPQDEPDWFDPVADAIIRFADEGELPDDDLTRDLVLADAEMDALWRHKRGTDVGELMAALDAAAQAHGEDREDAIVRVQDVVRQRPREPFGPACSPPSA
jgi:hypothetical protein